jgi:hypothetical protein
MACLALFDPNPFINGEADAFVLSFTLPSTQSSPIIR